MELSPAHQQPVHVEVESILVEFPAAFDGGAMGFGGFDNPEKENL
jgi:hypothetical protein